MGLFVWKFIDFYLSNRTEEYRKSVKVRKELSKQQYTYECTVYDLLHGLRMETDYLYAEVIKISSMDRQGANVKYRDVTRRYRRKDHSANTSVKQAVSIQSDLSRQNMKAIGIITDMGLSDVIVHSADLSPN